MKISEAGQPPLRVLRYHTSSCVSTCNAHISNKISSKYLTWFWKSCTFEVLSWIISFRNPPTVIIFLLAHLHIVPKFPLNFTNIHYVILSFMSSYSYKKSGQTDIQMEGQKRWFPCTSKLCMVEYKLCGNKHYYICYI